MADTNKESLSQEELNVTLQFASGLYNGLQGFGYATPFTQNQNLIGFQIIYQINLESHIMTNKLIKMELKNGKLKTNL